MVVTPKAKKNADELATAAAAVIGAKLEAKREGKTPIAAIEATIKRITPGAKISEWRVVRSQRTASPAGSSKAVTYEDAAQRSQRFRLRLRKLLRGKGRSIRRARQTDPRRRVIAAHSSPPPAERSFESG